MGTDILKKLYQSKNENIKVRALVVSIDITIVIIIINLHLKSNVALFSLKLNYYQMSKY